MDKCGALEVVGGGVHVEKGMAYCFIGIMSGVRGERGTLGSMEGREDPCPSTTQERNKLW